jgi:hypothetical protein
MTTAVRGCGSRNPGGIYLVTKMGSRGRRLVDCLVDPAVPVPSGLDLMDRGQLIAERVVDGIHTGIYDVYDRIGSRYYPNVWDFYMEVAAQGASRRVHTKSDFSKITSASRMVFVHEKAIVENAAELYQALLREERDYGQSYWTCPCGIEEHTAFPTLAESADTYSMATCVGCYRQLVTGGDLVLDPSTAPRTVEREVGSVKYRARKAPEKFAPEYSEGIFLVLPITCIQVVKDPEGGTDGKAMEAASRSDLDVELTNE